MTCIKKTITGFCRSLAAVTAHLSEEMEGSVQERSSVQWEYSLAINSAITASFTSVKRSGEKSLLHQTESISAQRSSHKHTGVFVFMPRRSRSVYSAQMRTECCQEEKSESMKMNWEKLWQFILDNSRNVSASKSFGIICTAVNGSQCIIHDNKYL